MCFLIKFKKHVMHILCFFHMKRNILSLIFICALSNILAQNTKVRWAKGTIADLVTDESG